MRERKRGSRCGCAHAAQRARAVQKVHCIYKSFIMNYTMVYLKWEACLVRGYMGYRDYNACASRERTEKEEGTGGGEGTRENRKDYKRSRILPGMISRVGVPLACALSTCLPSRTHTRANLAYARMVRARTRLQIDIAGRMPAPE